MQNYQATLSDRIKHCEDQLSEIISEILEKCKNQTSTQEIDQIATLLWNCSISQKHSISSIALLRQSSLDLFSSIILVDSASFPQLSKLSLLAIKTGSSWFTAGDHIKAHNAYIKASSFIDRFSSLKADKATATKIIVFHGLYKAQLLFTSNPPLAFHVLLGLNQADFNLLEKNDRTNLANISLSSAKCENKEHAIEWLRFGAELGPKTSQIRGQILLMLANTYLELSREGDLDLSLSTLDVLLTTGNETLASAAALVKIKVLVAKNSPVHTVSLVFEESITLLTQNTMPKSIDVYFAMIHLIAKFFDTSAALNAINLVHSRIAKFANKKSITDRLFVTSLYFLINPTTPTDNSSEIEKLVDICGEIGTESLRSCMILVWQAGERSLESDIKVSIYWFLLAVKLMGDKTDKTNCAIVFRKLALCYNELSLFREMAECIHSGIFNLYS